LVRELIKPVLSRGDVELADRFHDSTTVYQGVARRHDSNAVAAINHFAVGECVPDLTFVLDLEPTVARDRLLRRARPVGSEDRMEQQPAAFYEAVRAGYIALAAENPERVRLVDASQPIAMIAEEVWTAARKVLN
jgi:dTMP kinase